MITSSPVSQKERRFKDRKLLTSTSRLKLLQSLPQKSKSLKNRTTLLRMMISKETRLRKEEKKQ